jgi:hypothetical protein
MTYDPDMIFSTLYEESPCMDNQVFLAQRHII